MVRLRKDTNNIIVQLGTTLNPQRTYATGTDTPYLTSSPSKGWKYPSFLVNWLLSWRDLYTSRKSSGVVVVKFMRFMYISMGAGSGSISINQMVPAPADQALQRMGWSSQLT